MAELDPAAADPDGLSTQARQRRQQTRRESQQAASRKAEEEAREEAGRQAGDLANRYALARAVEDAQDWDQALTEAGLRSPAVGPIFPTVTRLVRTAWMSRSVRLTAGHE